jgi:hypothetical protein
MGVTLRSAAIAGAAMKASAATLPHSNFLINILAWAPLRMAEYTGADEAFL